MIDLVFAFTEIAKDLRPEYVERWLKGEVEDYDMDMMLLNEKHCRQSTYIKLQNLRDVKQ